MCFHLTTTNLSSLRSLLTCRPQPRTPPQPSARPQRPSLGSRARRVAPSAARAEGDDFNGVSAVEPSIALYHFPTQARYFATLITSFSPSPHSPWQLPGQRRTFCAQRICISGLYMDKAGGVPFALRCFSPFPLCGLGPGRLGHSHCLHCSQKKRERD